VTTETVDDDARRAVTAIAESFSTRVAVPALREAHVAADAIANDLLPDLSQEFPVMKSHVGGLSDTAGVLGVWSFEELGFRRGFPSEERRDRAVSEGRQDQ
jgi:hypothetical protein